MTSEREHRDTRDLRRRAPADAVSVELEVPFHDLDPLFVAWHGWYYKYFEIARTALFRAHRIDAVDMIPLNLGFYVVETRARHVRPLRRSRGSANPSASQRRPSTSRFRRRAG